MMKSGALFQLLLALCAYPGFHASEVLVDDPGDGITVALMEMVPNMLGYPDINDPPLKVNSNVPVSILRYYDATYLEGQQPIQKQDVYIIVKSDCSSPLDVRLDYTEYDRSNFTPWDSFNYTESISIDVVPSENITLLDTDFLVPSTFLAYWNYTSFWCNEFPPLGGNATGGNDTDLGLEEVTPSPSTAVTPTPAPTTANLKDNMTPSNAAAATLSSNSAPKFGMLTTIFAGIVGAIMMLPDSTRTRKASVTIMAGLVVMGALLISFRHVQEENVSQYAIPSVPNAIHGRRLQQEGGETCTASVEIIIDSCRRSMLENKVDLEVEAPALRILGIDLTELSNEPSPDNPCTTDYIGSMVFNETDALIPNAQVTTDPDTQTFLVDSLTDDWENGVQCSRAIEGRPFVDDNGHPLHAQIEAHQPAWSADKVYSEDISMDEALGKEWAERALGEHASVPAFAAFTIALMSNNAPPKLVQDALTAAMDEVRHAVTSFEVASLLLGTTVEPGPIPPSTHTFVPDMTALAVAAAQEGCIDETLSALAAAYEVDTRLDQNSRINDFTKNLLKEKIRTIALEEARHSALAWRTVHWGCVTDPDVCSTVEKSIFDPQSLGLAFEKRFGRFEVYAELQSAWQKVTSTLIPFVITDTKVAGLDCDLAVSRHLKGSTLLEEMAMQIIRGTVCA